MSDQVIIHVVQVGRLGNRMIQHMAALFLASRIPNAVLSGIDIPEWGLYSPDRRAANSKTFTVRIDTPMRMPVEEMLAKVARGEVNCIEIRNYVQHIDNLLPAQFYRKLYLSRVPKAAAARIASDELLINLRGEEILFGVAPDYVTIPVNYLREIVEETGLRPVVMGQLTPGPYLDQLRECFPGARFLPTEGPMVDFETIRGARNIVLSVSSFSWLAAWLSEAERIFFPVAGLFNPWQRPDIMMLPLDDPRFRFDVLPMYFALPFGEAIAHHARIDRMWRRYPGSFLKKRLARATHATIDPNLVSEFFDEGYYLDHNPDVKRAKESGAIPSGAEHYSRTGYREGRWPFHVDRLYYCHEYPDAAFELTTGEFQNIPHHYAEVGASRQYRRVRPTLEG